MSESHLVVHHVGGRSGSRSFPVMPAFERDIINVMYDADESCLAQVMDNWKAQLSKTIVLPYCLSGNDGVCKFHINYDPYSSSIYPLNPRYAGFYTPPPEQSTRQGFDHVLGDAFRTVREVQLPITTLDAVVLDKGEVPGPDFLSIDTQGSELDILHGSSRLLGTTILAVHAEVEFHPLYDGQPLFGDICHFLAKHNFDLVDIQLFSKLLPMRGKQGFRGEGYVAHGEALFIKRPDTVTDSIQLNKLAFIATIFGQFECATQCFESKNFRMATQMQNIADHRQPRYLNFISRLERAVDSLPQRSLPLFSDVYSFTQSDARFHMQTSSAGGLKVFLKTITPLVTVVRLAKSALRLLSRALSSTYTFRIPIIIWCCWWLKRSGSTVEELFAEFGMKDQYRLAMKNRIADSWAQRSSNR
jgi:FkbM family methyltransferase